MTPQEAREAAGEILSRDEFHGSSTPRPLRGVLRRLGELLEPIGGPLADAFDWVVRDPSRYLPIAVVVVVAAAVVAIAMGRRRAAPAGSDGGRMLGARGEDASELERRAAAAERAGELELAVRLRFRAGLVRLGDQGAVAYRPSLTAGAAVRAVRVPALVDLAAAFEEIAYGGRRASTDDVDAARTVWPRVLREARP